LGYAAKATGLNYMQARFYDPALGRFLSIDPVGFSPDQPFIFGRYTYVGNDPINSWDPFGEELVVIGDEDFKEKVEAVLEELRSKPEGKSWWNLWKTQKMGVMFVRAI
jgi:RHS repeat-associated protein